MRIFHIPAYTDNYIWVLQSGSDISVIDPGDASPVIKLINTNKLNLVDILLTHHHFDHVGGTLELKKPVSYTHRRCRRYSLCRSRWSPYH